MIVDEALEVLSADFERLYTRLGRPSIPPEKPLRALLLHASTTDLEAKLYRKGNGRESKLCFMGHILIENRNGLVVQAKLTQAHGRAERDAALSMLDRRRQRL